VIAAFAVLMAAIMGFVINTTIAKGHQHSELFAQQSNRETARDSLRASVFDVLAQNVVPQIQDKDFQKVALLAAFHGNFSKFMDTRPVFAAFLREVHGAEARHELRRLAKRVARQQADYIVAHGGDRVRRVVYWSKGDLSQAQQDARQPFQLTNDHTISIVVENVKVADVVEAPEVVAAADDSRTKRPIDDIATEIDVEVVIDNTNKARFSVSFLDAPYIDNIFVLREQGQAGDVHRIALILLDVTDATPADAPALEQGAPPRDPIYEVEFEVVHFPDNIVMPGDVPSAEVIMKSCRVSDSHDSDESHGAR